MAGIADTGWPVNDVTQRAYDQVYPVSIQDQLYGWPLLAYVNALGEMFQQMADIVEDGPNGEPGWSVILDINRTKDEGLPYLAQFIGLNFYKGLTAAVQRQQIRDHISWLRGTPSSISSAIGLFLTGTRTVQFLERTPDAYAFQVTIWASEAPADTSSTSALVRYVNQFAKPAGLNWTLTVNPGTPPATTYVAIYNRGDSYANIFNNYQTYNDIR